MIHFPVIVVLCLVVSCGLVSAISGTDTVLYSPNLTLDEESGGVLEFSTFFNLDNNSLIWLNEWREKKFESPLHKNTIYLLNLSSNTTRLVSESPGPSHRYSFRPPLALSGSGIVWSEFGTNDLFLYNVTSGSETSLTTDGSNPYEQWENSGPGMDADRIVWSRRKPMAAGYDQDIVFQNLTTKTVQQICTENRDQIDPSISGSRVVWTDKRDEPGDGDIYLFDMATGNETPVCIAEGLQQKPQISGNSIVWMDYRDGKPAVYLYNISSGSEARISRDLFVTDAPVISGDLVAWQEYSVLDTRDERGGSIVVYTISSGIREVLPISASFPQLLDLDRRRILYADTESPGKGYVHLYIIDIPAETPVPSPPARDTGDERPTPRVTTTPFRPGTSQASPLPAIPLAAGGIVLVIWMRNRWGRE